MTRLLRSLQFGFVALTLLLFGTVAHAGPQQKVSVLGLEAVVGANGQIDPADTQFARELTKELRSRVNNSKNYTLTKDTRELVDEKLMGSCGSEQPDCMGPIGKAVGADVVLFGRVANAKGGGYTVTLTLVDVKKRSKINTDTGSVSQAETRNPGLGNWVREHYRKLTNDNADGTLVIIAAGAGDGRVIVGNETREKLRSGRAEITLPEGRYKVGVEADGFRLWEQDVVTITAGERSELKPDLVKSKPIDNTITDPNGKEDGTTGTADLISREGTVDSKSKKSSRLGWKIAAGVGFGGAAVTGAMWIIRFKDAKDFEPVTKDLTFTNADGVVDSNIEVSMFNRDDCKGTFTGTGDIAAAKNELKASCDAHKEAIIYGSATIVLAAAGSVALYMALRKDGTEERPAGAGRQKKRNKNFIVTPVVSPDGTGATLRFDW